MAEWSGEVYEGEHLDWGFIWTAALPSGDTVSSSTWDVGSSLVVTKEQYASGKAEVWLTNFAEGSTYTLTNTLVTEAGRSYDQSITLTCPAIGDGLSGGTSVYDAITVGGDNLVWSDGSQWIFVE
jgi:hypothetical protein